MNIENQVNQYIDMQEARECSIEKIKENTKLNDEEALAAYENGQLAHIYEPEPYEFEDCGDYER